MKIAFVALPRQEDVHSSRFAPPLPLGYVAAMLEQRRHIVRVYDLALSEGAIAAVLAPLRSFRPHLTVIAASTASEAASVDAVLAGLNTHVMWLGTALRDGSIAQAISQALWQVDDHVAYANEQSVIFEALLALDDNIDAMPFPARHLLSLEQYPLFTLEGELQTTVLVAQQLSASYTAVRNPANIVAEVQSVMREHGIRHFVFAGAPVTQNLVWLNDLLQQLVVADLGMQWEASVGYSDVTPELVKRLQQVGCESICFELVAGDVLISREKRAVLSAAAQLVRTQHLGVRADIQLDQPYSLMPSLIDVSATLGLDTAHFHVQRNLLNNERMSIDGVSLEDIAEMARTRYRSSRSRQFFVDRFGAQLGPMLWRVGRAGLLGRTWQHYADGDEKVLAL